VIHEDDVRPTFRKSVQCVLGRVNGFDIEVKPVEHAFKYVTRDS
jgi:hypothetical protein